MRPHVYRWSVLIPCSVWRPQHWPWLYSLLQVDAPSSLTIPMSTRGQSQDISDKPPSVTSDAYRWQRREVENDFFPQRHFCTGFNVRRGESFSHTHKYVFSNFGNVSNPSHGKRTIELDLIVSNYIHGSIHSNLVVYVSYTLYFKASEFNSSKHLQSPGGVYLHYFDCTWLSSLKHSNAFCRF